MKSNKEQNDKNFKVNFIYPFKHVSEQNNKGLSDIFIMKYAMCLSFHAMGT